MKEDNLVKMIWAVGWKERRERDGPRKIEIMKYEKSLHLRENFFYSFNNNILKQNVNIEL